jgi:ABC-type branched-subunit amino acid transport system substrate-binding protein
MRKGRARRLATLGICAVVAVSAIGLTSTQGAAQVPGFDGSTIKVAGYGLSELPSVPIGAKARIKEFNDAQEIKGVKIEFADYADDKSDPATALSEARRLVSQEQVFAIVPEVSVATPGEYLAQQKIPVFGGGFSAPYCSAKPTTTLWLFGYLGCQVTDKPTIARDTEANILEYVQKATGKQHPTVAQLSADDAVGHAANELFRATFEGNPGWGKLVYNQAAFPPPSSPVGDLSPYVQALETSNNGKAPDFIRCSPVACVGLYQQLRASGYTGEFEHNIYTDLLVKPFEGSIVAIPHHNLNETGNAALEKLKASVAEISPGTKLDTGIIDGYLSTDMFIQALKKAAKGGKSNITRDRVQKAASTMTWQIKDLAGPTRYPASTVTPTPLCREVVKSDGTQWVTVVPFSCNDKGYKIKQ